MSYYIFSLIVLVVLAASCNNTDVPAPGHPDFNNLYLDYTISGNEEKGEVVCRFQYKWKGPNGATPVLEEPAGVSFDGEPVKADTAPYTGIYYEVIRPVQDFKVDHKIVFTNPEGKKYEEKISFRPFTLANELPASIPRKPLVIRLKDLEPENGTLRLVLTDTSFGTSWVNEMVKVEQGQLSISGPMLNRLKPGPVSMELYQEEEKKLKQTTRRGGRLVVNYSIKREFLLRDGN